MALSLQDRFEKNIDHFQKGLRIDPLDADVHNNIGLVFKKNQGDPDSAMLQFSRAVTLYRQDSGALDNRGVMLMDHGQLEVAGKHFARALKTRPGYEKVWLNLDEADGKLL